jgi:hypothetical protein
MPLLGVERVVVEIGLGGEGADEAEQLEGGPVGQLLAHVRLAVHQHGIERRHRLVAHEGDEEVGVEGPLLDVVLANGAEKEPDPDLGGIAELGIGEG